MSEMAVEVRGARVTYSSDTSVGPIDLTVRDGSCLGLIGANGAGKTTLLRVIAGLLRTDAGEVRVHDEPVVFGNVPRNLSGMIEEPKFFSWLDARHNLLPLCGHAPERRERIPNVLQRVSLDPASRRPVAQFSQGMRQRLAIARVLLTDAAVLIFDEPTNGLDPVGIRWFRGLVSEFLREGRTVILSSHMLHEVQQMADSFCMIADGHVISSGSVQDLQEISSLEELYFSVTES